MLIGGGGGVDFAFAFMIEFIMGVGFVCGCLEI